MDMLKTGWNFFQNEVVGMAWLNRLIGNLINACGLDATSKIGGGIQFFVYDTIKIMVLLGVLILIISYIQSYFPPERAKKILGRFHGIGANIISALLGMAISTRQVKNKRDSNGVLTGRPGTVYDVNIKYTAPNGEKKTYSKKGFPTKKEATQHEAEMKAKLHNPGQIASIASQRKQTVASYLNEWVESYARVNLRPSTYDGYKRTIANYITPYIGGVALNQLTPAMVDKMFQQIIDKGLKPSTAAGAKRVLSVALSHARKYRYIETNAAKDTLTKFGKSDKTPDPYTPEQVKALMQRVEGTVWEMPVILGGLYGMRRSEILGLRWRNVDLENNTFDVSEQLPFKVPPKTKVIEEMAPPKSNGRKLPITELARPFFLKQFAMQEAQREQAEKDGKPYYDNDLVVAKPDGSPSLEISYEAV